MKHLNPKQRRLLLLAAIALWLISLPLPVFIFGQNHDYDGITTLFLGTIFGFTTREIGYYAVYANYIWLFIVITLMFRPCSRTTGSILNACLWAVALLTFTLDEIILNEAGHRAAPTYGLGLYLWFASFAVTTLTDLCSSHRPADTPEAAQQQKEPS
ncbi:protein-(glutamine-N5) methyltransferase [Kingella denitrificans]|uniref:protein-(glutamine-N5) methyltransferase n=1 Tax=Kingella denitrificans TaxID=502 RepID=UPI0028D0B2A4|nr:protein-(glutamine-N5) methyltransferase [Kingella denitrificans]